YGYVHFKGARGIIAARNPLITPGSLKIGLSPSLGIDPKASRLVLERVYPGRWISPRLVSANERIDLPLDGYETAIYEIYPVEEASGPLLAGVPFTILSHDASGIGIDVYGSARNAKILNPAKFSIVSGGGSSKESVRDPLPGKSLTF